MVLFVLHLFNDLFSGMFYLKFLTQEISSIYDSIGESKVALHSSFSLCTKSSYSVLTRMLAQQSCPNHTPFCLPLQFVQNRDPQAHTQTGASLPGRNLPGQRLLLTAEHRLQLPGPQLLPCQQMTGTCSSASIQGWAAAPRAFCAWLHHPSQRNA